MLFVIEGLRTFRKIYLNTPKRRKHSASDVELYLNKNSRLFYHSLLTDLWTEVV